MFKLIVCPLDLRERSYQVLPVAGDLARMYNAKLIYLYVNHMFMTRDEMVMLRVSVEHYEKMTKDIASNARLGIEKAIKEYGMDDIEHEILLRHGTPGHDIPKISERLGADLIVISTTGHTHLREMLIGSTAEAVLRRTKISVLTVAVDAIDH